jgi:hypothetical protein
MAKAGCSPYPVGSKVKVSAFCADAVPAWMLGVTYEIFAIYSTTVLVGSIDGGDQFKITPIVFETA